MALTPNKVIMFSEGQKRQKEEVVVLNTRSDMITKSKIVKQERPDLNEQE